MKIEVQMNEARPTAQHSKAEGNDELATILAGPIQRTPEILAPVGSPAMLAAALAARADAVYFGLEEGLNARAKAKGFSLTTLRATVAQIHRAHARAYVTLNTLVFHREIPKVAEVLHAIASAGVDAIIVQDPAVVLLARAICPALRIHASTQMTISSAEGARFAQALGCSRMVVPRECSVDQIALLRSESDLELEVFVHGALCMSWSGQCLSSEAWDQRSANRGLCNQACRMPYALVVDGQTKDLGDVRYLLSPKDLAGFRAIPRLMESGISALKIEGRYKSPAYVAHNVESYRAWRDALLSGATKDDLARASANQQISSLLFSRGFSDGHLGGSDHQNLVEGRFPKHRGEYLGRVKRVAPPLVWVQPETRPPESGVRKGRFALPVLGGSADASSALTQPAIEMRAGMGLVFDSGQPENPSEPGGSLYSASREANGEWRLDFGPRGRHIHAILVGSRAWVSSDHALESAIERHLSTANANGRWKVSLRVQGRLGDRLSVRATTQTYVAQVESTSALESAAGAGLDRETLREKLGGFGPTPLHLEEFDAAELQSGLFLPVSQLKEMKRQLVKKLVDQIEAGPPREIAAVEAIEPIVLSVTTNLERTRPLNPTFATPLLIPLCRSMDQLQAAIDLGLPEVELDWMEFIGLRQAVERAKTAGMRVIVASVRVQKPGEEGYDRRISALEPDGVLVRHWGALMHFARNTIEPERHDDAAPTPFKVHGDFSLNVTNAITARYLLNLGLETVTAAHDLDHIQLGDLMNHSPAGRVAITIHHHMPLFHNDHCVYAQHLSQGRDFRTCGRPCDHHQIAVRDHEGCEHPIVVDVECRNTLFHGRAQSAAPWLAQFIRQGAVRLRAEFVRESRDATHRILRTYLELLDNRISPSQAARELGALEQFGVTRGTMATI